MKATKESTTNTMWMQWNHHTKGMTHCETCLALDQCWFAADLHPRIPHHIHCHCTPLPIPQAYAAMCAETINEYSKYVPYLFNTKGEYTHHKEKLFASWGYAEEDAHWLRQEIDRQGRAKYVAGDYTLGKLDHNGQRISIRIELPRKSGDGMVSFISGWIARPFGTIKLTTPYGGK